VRDREDALANTRDARTTQNLAALARIGVSILNIAGQLSTRLVF
jgi:collagenase-like PrtC family protease